MSYNYTVYTPPLNFTLYDTEDQITPKSITNAVNTQH